MDNKNLKDTFCKIGNILYKINIVQFIRHILILGAWGTLAVLIYVLYVAHDLPDISQLEKPRKGRKVTILDHNGQPVITYGHIYGYFVPYSNIPKNLVHAVISIEDKRFFKHFGVDIWGILRAFLVNLRAGGKVVQGGSTLTQQLAKIVFLSPARTLKRKAQEALLAIELERNYSKEQIMSIYLNRVYLGSGLYGIDSAAKYYFGKNVQDLNLYECVIIAGLLRAPSRLAPTGHPELAGQRAYQVLLNMLEQGYVSKDKINEAGQFVKLNTSLLGSKDYGYFTSWVYENIGNYISSNEVDISVKTSLDKRIQTIAQTTLNRYLSAFGEEKKVSQGAVIVLNRQGKVLALVGGRDFSASPFNRATQSLRPAGSSFKIFVYTAAMEQGYTPESKFEDKPVKFGSWAPENYYKTFLGEVTLREAFAKSLNTVSVQLGYKIGVPSIIDIARKLGISAEIEHDLSITLGSPSVSLIEMAGVYATIANDGLFTNPYAIESIENSRTGDVLYVKHSTSLPRVIEKSTAMTMQALLRNAVLNGSGYAAITPEVEISGKTGTSQDWRDAWFLSFSNKYVVGVWVGNDDYSPMKRVSGSTYPTQIAKDIFLSLK